MVAQERGTLGTKRSTVTTVQREDRYYRIIDGKKKYISNSKTQKMWTEILTKYPAAISIAEKYNVNIYQNTLYKPREYK